MHRAMILSLACLLAGCGDSVVGSWRGESPTSCGIGEDTLDFTVEGDFTGTGKVCNCDFDFDVTKVDDHVYEVTLDFQSGCLALDGTYECDLAEGGETLDCGTLGEFTRGG